MVGGATASHPLAANTALAAAPPQADAPLQLTSPGRYCSSSSSSSLAPLLQQLPLGLLPLSNLSPLADGAAAPLPLAAGAPFATAPSWTGAPLKLTSHDKWYCSPFSNQRPSCSNYPPWAVAPLQLTSPGRWCCSTSSSSSQHPSCSSFHSGCCPSPTYLPWQVVRQLFF